MVFGLWRIYISLPAIAREEMSIHLVCNVLSFTIAVASNIHSSLPYYTHVFLLLLEKTFSVDPFPLSRLQGCTQLQYFPPLQVTLGIPGFLFVCLFIYFKQKMQFSILFTLTQIWVTRVYVLNII